METQTGLSLKVKGMLLGDNLSVENWLDAYRETSNWIRWNHAAAVESFEELNDLLSNWVKIDQIQFNNGLALLLKCHMNHSENHWSCDVKLLAVVRDTGLSDLYLTNVTHGSKGCRSTEATEQMRAADSDDDYQRVPGTPKNTSRTENTGSPSSVAHFVDEVPSMDKIQLDATSSDGSVAMEDATDIPLVPEGHQEIKYKITTDVTNLKIDAIYGTIYHFDCHLWVILFSGKKMPSLVPASVMKRHFPEKVIAFYQRRIDWDTDKSTFKVRLSQNNPALTLAKFQCSCVTKPY